MIKIAARDSKLSQRQIEEVIEKILQIDSTLSFHIDLVKTKGDLDQITSLRSLGKTDFFTKEVDQMILEHQCDVAIHSAKDLPNPIPKGLVVAAITKGIDPRDTLIMREEDTFFSLSSGSMIATSSLRREEMINRYRTDLQFIDLRGAIQQRIDLIYDRKADGVVVAEAALIRLNLTHINRFIFPDSTDNLQGKLAILIRENHHQMVSFFKKVHGR